MATRHGTRVPVLPEVAARLVAAAKVMPNGCRLTALTPSKDRPWVWINDGRERQVSAIRVVSATALGRPIEPEEDVHHTCETPRCVEENHLVVLPVQEHSDHHAESLEQATCSVHRRPYDRRDSRGWGVCVECQREATRRWAAANPDKLRNRQCSDETKAKRRASAKAHRSTPEYRARAAAAQRERRARLKAAQEQQPME
ncbi:hypothetical protein ACFYNV_29820 [Streptomyces albidoflavus]